MTRDYSLQRLLGWLPRAWADLDAQAQAARALRNKAEGTTTADDQRVKQLLVVAAVLLTLGYSFGDRPFFDTELAPRLLSAKVRAHYGELLSYTYWAWAKVLGYGLLPLLHIKLWGESPRDYGLAGAAREGSPLALGHAWPWHRIYVLLFVLILPVVAILSTTSGFQQIYPFYRLTGRSLFDLLSWEIQYLSTFVAVEFFFRGYLLFGLWRLFGSVAIFISMVPYCLIHVLKPPSEALGSIFAGILLGTLALRTGSVWCGALLHISVALAMDLFSAWHGHRLPSGLWPKF